MALELSEIYVEHALSKGRVGHSGDQPVYAKSPLESRESKLQFANELLIFASIKNIDGVLQPIDYVDGAILFPFVEYDLLTLPYRLDIEKQILLPLLDVLAQFELRHLCHGDIKPANVRVTAAGQVFLTDFGKAKFFNRHCANYLGSISQHQAPDISLSTQSDLYSLGVMAYQLLISPHYMRDFAFNGRPKNALATLTPNLQNFIILTTEPSALNRCQTVAEARAILLGITQDSSIELIKYDIESSFEICLAAMKATFQASAHPIATFDKFIGDHGCTYHSRLKSWQERDDALLMHLKVGGRIVGAIEAAVNKQGEAQISTLFIHEKFRRKGFAQMLEREAAGFFKAKGFKTLFLNVTKANLAAIAFYQIQGWKESAAAMYPGSILFKKSI